MIYIRGNRGDYDEWRRSGNEGWAYDDVLPYFVKAEGNQAISDRYHGTAGPLAVSDHSPSNPLVKRYFAAAQQVGLRFNPDFNGEYQEGYGPATLSQTALAAAPPTPISTQRVRVRT